MAAVREVVVFVEGASVSELNVESAAMGGTEGNAVFVGEGWGGGVEGTKNKEWVKCREQSKEASCSCSCGGLAEEEEVRLITLSHCMLLLRVWEGRASKAGHTWRRFAVQGQ
jgi:hypothetical protein